MTTVTFSVLNRELVVTDAATGRPRWSGRPLGLPVEDVQPISDSADAIVLLDYAGAPQGPCRNLVRIDPDGRVVWEGELPTSSSTEAYVSFQLDGKALTANSWSSNHVQLDLGTGRIDARKFTK